MRLLVGLGNPGEFYKRNRHNIGYRMVDKIVHHYSFQAWRTKFKGKISEGTIDDQEYLLLKPETFMNLSGESVSAIVRFYKISLDDIWIFHDELDLVPGKIRIKKGGGAGGHNGLKSIDQAIGQDYWRVRLGIGHPGYPDAVTPWVLGNFSPEEEENLSRIFSKILENFTLLVKREPEKFMTAVMKT
jgi:PTH1 family peptidyl-tRNA hydrolase